MEQPRPRVLVVEDDVAAREGLVSLLASRFDVLAAGNGEDAVRVAAAERPDVVLSGLLLPGMDGLATLNKLRQQPGLHGLPVVFLSGSQDAATVEQCLEEGAADFVARPVPDRELLARLARAVRHRREVEALEALAQTDGLTGLANFRALNRRLEEEFKRAARYGHPLAVVIIDLDHLKAINDAGGHEAGNRAILRVADELGMNLRETDFAARFGGDEFVVLLPHQSSSEAAVFAERLRSALHERPLDPESAVQRRLSVSVGVASRTAEAPKDSPEHLFQAADAALYEAKRRGRNQVAVFERTLTLLQPGVAHQH